MKQLIQETKALQEKLLNDEITFETAFKELKSRPKPWLTKEWKTIRKILIGKECTKCGISDKNSILILQHTKQPPKFSTIRNHIKNLIFQKYIAENDISIEPTKDEIDKWKKANGGIRNCCPVCKSVNIKERINSVLKWKCNKFGCHNNFNLPIKREYYHPLSNGKDFRVSEHVASMKRKKIERVFYLQHEELINRLSLIESLEFTLEYYSMKDTVTMCKKCAFQEDIWTHFIPKDMESAIL